MTKKRSIPIEDGDSIDVIIRKLLLGCLEDNPDKDEFVMVIIREDDRPFSQFMAAPLDEYIHMREDNHWGESFWKRVKRKGKPDGVVKR